MALVQYASGTATSGTTVTVALGSATTAGNCLIVGIGTTQGTTTNGDSLIVSPEGSG